MSSKILFLYFNKKHKAELLKCESIIKSLFRKFRKSVVFTYVEIDTSLSCRDAFKDLIYKEIENSHAVLLKGDYESFNEEEIFFRDILPFSVAEYHSAGKVLFYPRTDKRTDISEDFITDVYSTSLENIQKATEICIKAVQNRKHTLSVCTQSENSTDTQLFQSLEDVNDKSLHINTEHISLEEIISLCIKTVPSFDVVLSREEVARLIGMHLDSGSRICSGFSVFHTEKGSVNMSKTTPGEEIDNSHFASVLLTFAHLIESELDMKNVAQWLRKSVAEAFETHSFTSFDEFSKKVVSEIQKPMRYTR